jgi:hypothetical protein
MLIPPYTCHIFSVNFNNLSFPQTTCPFLIGLNRRLQVGLHARGAPLNDYSYADSL